MELIRKTSNLSKIRAWDLGIGFQTQSYIKLFLASHLYLGQIYTYGMGVYKTKYFTVKELTKYSLVNNIIVD